jgi:hypothetical protein
LYLTINALALTRLQVGVFTPTFAASSKTSFRFRQKQTHNPKHGRNPLEAEAVRGRGTCHIEPVEMLSAAVRHPEGFVNLDEERSCFIAVFSLQSGLGWNIRALNSKVWRQVGYKAAINYPLIVLQNNY